MVNERIFLNEVNSEACLNLLSTSRECLYSVTLWTTLNRNQIINTDKTLRLRLNPHIGGGGRGSGGVIFDTSFVFID